MNRAVVRGLAACLTALALLCGVTSGAAAAAGPPAPVGLDDAAWQYAPDAQDRGLAEGWQAGGGPAAAWRGVRLPHVFDPHPDPSTFHGLVGWYRLPLTAPRAPRGFTWAVRFEQVRRVAQVWLDGRPLATNRDPYTPFTVPLPALSDGRRHELVLRVDNRKGREPREGWWNWGGITRPAELVPLGALVVHDPGFLPRERCDAGGGHCRWSVLVDAMVENRSAATQRPRLTAALSAPDGSAAGGASATARPLAPGETARVRFSVPVEGQARLWGPGHPALYGATLRTADSAGVQQVDRARIGLRTVAVRNGLLELNGRPIELRGASIQEDVDGHGAALTDADIDGIVRRLQAIGANVTRAHYALDERLQRKLDQAGIMVWAQAPIYHRDRLLETPVQRDAALATVRAAVLATRNHPATITHSVANELSVVPDVVPGTRDFLLRARALTQDLDPTLPVSVDTLSYPGYPRQRTYATFDLIGINSYFGWYPGKPDHSTADGALLRPYLQEMRARYPRSALVLTEFGAEATMPGPPQEKETFAFQADYARDVLGVADTMPGISGAIYWTLQEFAVKPHWDGGAERTGVPRDSIHNKGLITYDGRPKPAWSVVRADIHRTPLQRPAADVALALGTHLPKADRGRVGAGVAIAVVVLVLLLLVLDAWAVAGWRTAVAAERRERLARGRAWTRSAEDDERPLRLIA